MKVLVLIALSFLGSLASAQNYKCLSTTDNVNMTVTTNSPTSAFIDITTPLEKQLDCEVSDYAAQMTSTVKAYSCPEPYNGDAPSIFLLDETKLTGTLMLVDQPTYYVDCQAN